MPVLPAPLAEDEAMFEDEDVAVVVVGLNEVGDGRLFAPSGEGTRLLLFSGSMSEGSL